MNRKNLPFIVIAVCGLFTLVHSAAALGTAFTYQGQLQSGGAPANGGYDFTFALFNNSGTNSGQVGSTLTNSQVGVTNGLFTVTLDFGPVFTGTPIWLAIGVRTNGGASFTPLSPLQALTPAPYAIFATTASNLSGTVSAGQLPSSVVSNNESGVSLSGNFNGVYTGLGSGLTALNPSNIVAGTAGISITGNAGSLGGLAASGFWQLGGNNVGAGQFLGSTNNQPVEIRVDNMRGMRLEPDTTGQGSPNVIGGSLSNTVTAGVVGATIAGGGQTNYSSLVAGNQIQTNYATISGGVANSITSAGQFGTIGGGNFNTVSNIYATVAGGTENTAGGQYSFVAGGGNIVTNFYGSIPGGLGGIAGGIASFVAGGDDNYAIGDHSWAAGYHAKATNTGAFVWADSGTTPFYSTNDNTFNVRALGGVVFETGGAGVTVDGYSAVMASLGAYSNIVTGTASGVDSGRNNTVSADFSFIGSGRANAIQTSAFDSFIGGGNANVIQVNAQNSAIVGGINNTVVGPYGFIGGGYGNIIESTALYGAIGGGYSNKVFNTGAFVGGGGYDGLTHVGNTANGLAAAVGAGVGNSAIGNYAAVFGGQFNLAGANRAFVGGGDSNSATGVNCTIGGGVANTSAVGYSFVGGGLSNSAGGFYSTVGGGGMNNASGPGAFIGGGGFNGSTVAGNTAGGLAGVVSGGQANRNTGNYGTIGGGGYNNVASPDGTIGGGVSNTVFSADATISGGANNYIFAPASVIGGGQYNNNQGSYGTIGGGLSNNLTSAQATIAGGVSNIARNLAGVVGGGILNTNYADYATIGGGWGNYATGAGAFIGGGGTDGAIVGGNQAGGNASVVGGGLRNSAGANYSTVGGGYGNGTGAFYASVGGGNGNSAGATAATVGGGQANIISGSGNYATIPGGYANSAGGNYAFAAGQMAQAQHQGAFVWADSQNATFASTGNDQFLIRAQGGVGINTATPSGAALDVNGTMIVSGFTEFSAAVDMFNTLNVSSTLGVSGAINAFSTLTVSGASIVNNSLTISPGNGTLSVINDNGIVPGLVASGGGASGHMRLRNAVEIWPNTNLTSSGFLDVRDTSGNAQITMDGQSGTVTAQFYNVSDRNLKEHFAPVDGESVLAKVAALPISEWNFKQGEASRHIGPMAQDFQAAFHVGMDDRHIATTDEGGVALAAIQGLNEKLESGRQKAEIRIARLEEENAELKARLQKLEMLVNAGTGETK